MSRSSGQRGLLGAKGVEHLSPVPVIRSTVVGSRGEN